MDSGQEQDYSARLISDLQQLVDFARENGITKLEAGGFAFELAPVEIAKHARKQVESHMTDREREEVRKRILEERKRRGRPKNLEYWSSPDPINRE